MTDALNGLERVERTVGNGKLAAGDARVVRLSRTYDAPIEDVWDALTSARADQPLVHADLR